MHEQSSFFASLPHSFAKIFLYLPLFLPGGLLGMRRKIDETVRANGNCCQYRLTCDAKRLAVSSRTCYMVHRCTFLRHSVTLTAAHTRRQKLGGRRSRCERDHFVRRPLSYCIRSAASNLARYYEQFHKTRYVFKEIHNALGRRND